MKIKALICLVLGHRDTSTITRARERPEFEVQQTICRRCLRIGGHRIYVSGRPLYPDPNGN